ncbi:hypothetical protein FH972_005416 [Carpinus fangiana]|uniref:Fe2OG dioxygenase domain-containing protein n=1 Tax=Carpinus fangiana TaxID=176857 RepID=A0A5N6QR10_9ROSI|nr:hypothetical protein FH972_005416 [Carpinus fangiana]
MEALCFIASPTPLFRSTPQHLTFPPQHSKKSLDPLAYVQIHTDSGFLTILQDDENVGGLEVMDKSGAFVAVHPCAGTLLVNLGDVAKAWSNGRFCNVKHRVQCKEATIRVSIASFVLGPKEAAVEAPPQLLDSQHPRLYAPFTYDDYRKLYISPKFKAGEALQHVCTHYS